MPVFTYQIWCLLGFLFEENDVHPTKQLLAIHQFSNIYLYESDFSQDFLDPLIMSVPLC